MRNFLLSFLLIGLTVARTSVAQDVDITRLGGDLTSDNSPKVALELPAPNIRPELFNFHLNGHTVFHQSFEFPDEQGRIPLGPVFNHNSCGGCHVKDGRGPIEFSRKTTSGGSAMLIKVSLRGLQENGQPRDVPGVGEQLRDHTIDGKNKFNIRLRWKDQHGTYPDGKKYKLRSPILTFTIPGFKNRDSIVHSLRMSPPTVGMGLLEAVSDSTIIDMSDPLDRNHDGISGRISFVINKETNGTAIGRFGFRASNPTIKQQSGAAFFNDMGMTNELFSNSTEPQEVSAEQMALVVFYQQAAGIPPARNQDNPSVILGKRAFQKIGCDGCHKMTLVTGNSGVPETANQTIHPFTDLLLHDMGPGLADRRPEFSASGREWKTSPLWGIGLHHLLSKSRPGYMHDGRARTIEEAILWHGGEAKKSRDRFMKLREYERKQLLDFLRSL